MSKTPQKKLSHAQLAELKATLLSLGVDRNKSAQLLTAKNQHLAYQDLVARGHIKPKPVAAPSAGSSVSAPAPVAFDAAKMKPSADVQRVFQSRQAVADQSKPGRGPGRRPKRVPYSILLDQELLEAYNRLSIEQERPVSELIRLALRRGLQTATVG